MDDKKPEVKPEIKKKTKVAIVGFTGTREQAPYNDPEFEIWTVNNLYRFVPRQDRIFELHTREQIAADLTHGVDGKTYVEEMAEMKIPIYMQERYPDIPTSVKYPLGKMIEEFGIERSNVNHKPDAYFTNSISFMIALAIYEGFKEIHVYGVDMAIGVEYIEQRPSCEYYLGIARGRGIKLFLPIESDLLKTRFIYGYDDQRKDAWMKKMESTLQHMNTQKQQSDMVIRNQQSVSDKYEGAITALHEMVKTWN
jgi:hypothetical protein